MRTISRFFSTLIHLLLIAATSVQAQGSSRISLVAGQPIEVGDIAGVGTLYYGDVGVTLASLNLSGLAAGSINDIFRVTSSGALCSAPMPLGAGGYQILTSGTPIGGMTAAAGIAAAFNGNTSQGYAASAQSSGVSIGYTLPNAVGKSFPTPVVVTQIKAWSPSDDGFLGSLANGGWAVLASNVNDMTTGVPIVTGKYTGGNADTVNYQFQNATGYLDLWFVIYGPGGTNSHVAQVQFLQSTPNPPRGLIAGPGLYDQADHDIPACNSGGGTTIDCPLGGCDHLGVIKIDASTPGQISCTLSYGMDRGCGIWNSRHQEPICLQAGDPSPPVPNAACHPGNPCYGYSPVAYGQNQPPYIFGPTEGNSLIRLRVLSGQPTQSIKARYLQEFFENATAAPSAYWFGIGINNTTQPAGLWPAQNTDNSGVSSPPVSTAIGTVLATDVIALPFIGEMTFNAIEGSRSGVTAYYGQANQLLEACYKY